VGQGVRPALSAEVAGALAAHGPVVALETTLVTHGFPHPRGLEVALRLEAIVRAGGATPATIGVLDGALRVGLSREELERIATAPDQAKLNPSNLAARLAAGGPGSTTVAATLLAAERAGIEVFATGGIGGVHRGDSGDVSADLEALARHRVAVVCAGAKAILDLPRTVERLETLGVPIYGWGTDRFPAFYRRDSGLPVDARFDDVDALAAAVAGHLALGLGGVIVANPIPAADELPAEILDRALEAALAAGSARGRDVTPLLLDRLREASGGASVAANVALLKHDARVGAELAAAMARRRRGDDPSTPGAHHR